MRKLIGWTMLLMGAVGSAFAQSPAPEIDASSSIAALALLSGGLMVLRSRKRK
jgi:LPXTG-motif cell wall-anchored protein